MIILDFPVSQFDNTTDCVIQVMRVILKTLLCNPAHFETQLLSQIWSVNFMKINHVNNNSNNYNNNGISVQTVFSIT